MSPFSVELTRTAMRDLDRLPLAQRDQVTGDLRTLAETPIGRPPRIKRLRGFPFPLYRLRSGDYRALYRIEKTLITVMRVIHRKDLEKALRRLTRGHPF